MATRRRPGPRLATILLLFAVAAGCGTGTSVEIAKVEFDSVAGLDDPQREPATASYSATPAQRAWALRTLGFSGIDRVLIALFGMRLQPTAVDNPSGFARERLQELIEYATLDRFHAAEAISRLHWVAFVDHRTLNRLEALRGAVELLTALGVDPLSWPAEDPGSGAESNRAVALTTFLERRGAAGSAAIDVDGYLAALETLTERPLSSGSDPDNGIPPGFLQRGLVRTLLHAARQEEHEDLVAPTLAALDRAIAHAAVSMVMAGYDSRDPAIQDYCARAVRRLSGPRAAAYNIARFAGRRPDPRADDDARATVERTLIRQCGALTGAAIHESVGDGPSPIEYLYDRLQFSDESKLVALEAMAHALGRPVTWDAGWAHAWWREYTTGGGNGR